MKKIAVIIPCYNEEKRIDTTLKAYANFAKSFNSGELYLNIVDDGSTDNTKEYAERFAKEHNEINVLVHSYNHNQGKGYALKYGIRNSNADFYYFADADLSAEWNTLNHLYTKLHELKVDGVIGSRSIKSSRVKTSSIKKFYGNIGNILIKIILGLPFKDTQCGYKLFTNKCRDYILNAENNRWAFDFEMLFLLKKEGLKIREIGIKWQNIEGSKVGFFDYIKTLIDLVRIRLRNM